MADPGEGSLPAVAAASRLEPFSRLVHRRWAIKSLWRCAVLVAAVMAASLLLAACGVGEEEEAAAPTVTTEAAETAQPTLTSTTAAAASPTVEESAPPEPTPLTCTHHVAPDGNDDNPGSAEAPWRTIQHAADTAEPRDTACIHAATYSEDVTFSRSGTADAAITFAAAPGETANVQGSLTLAPGTSYLQLIGFALQGFSIWGVTLEGDNHHVLLSHLDVAGGEAGVRITDGNSGEDPPIRGRERRGLGGQRYPRQRLHGCRLHAWPLRPDDLPAAGNLRVGVGSRLWRRRAGTGTRAGCRRRGLLHP